MTRRVPSWHRFGKSNAQANACIQQCSTPPRPTPRPRCTRRQSQPTNPSGSPVCRLRRCAPTSERVLFRSRPSGPARFHCVLRPAMPQPPPPSTLRTPPDNAARIRPPAHAVIASEGSTHRTRLPQFLPHTTKQPETTRNTRKQVPLCFFGDFSMILIAQFT